MPWPQRSPATTRGQAHGWRYTAYVLFGRGIKTDEYETLPEFNILDSASAVENAFADNIPAGQGVVVDDNQPYPLYGWLEVKWVTRRGGLSTSPIDAITDLFATD